MSSITVTRIKDFDEDICTACSVSYVGRHPETGKPAVYCNQEEGARTVWTSGVVYVMNRHGATIAKYNLD